MPTDPDPIKAAREQVTAILAADPVCVGRVSTASIDAIVGLFEPLRDRVEYAELVFTDYAARLDANDDPLAKDKASANRAHAARMRGK